MEKEILDLSDLEEGCLYAYKKGVLIEVETDPDDVMKRVKITEDAFAQVVQLQRNMRREMSGYKPDIHLICSALIAYAGKLDCAKDVVRKFCVGLFTEGTIVEK